MKKTSLLTIALAGFGAFALYKLATFKVTRFAGLGDDRAANIIKAVGDIVVERLNLPKAVVVSEGQLLAARIKQAQPYIGTDTFRIFMRNLQAVLLIKNPQMRMQQFRALADQAEAMAAEHQAEANAWRQ